MMIPRITTSLWLKRCASRTMPPMPGMPLMVSAATIVVNANATATRMPVITSGSTMGKTPWRTTCMREAPSVRRASTLSSETLRTASLVASTIGGKAARKSRTTFGVSSMPNQMTSRLK